MGAFGLDASKYVLFAFAFHNSGSHGIAPRKVQKTCEDSLPLPRLFLAQGTWLCLLSSTAPTLP